MNAKRIARGLAALVMSWTLHLVEAGDVSLEIAIEDLRTGSRDDRKRGEATILAEIELLKDRLLELAKAPTQHPIYEDRDPRLVAIELLGRLRSAEAVPFLLENVTLEFTRESGGREQIYQGRACVIALIQIGKPSVQGILNGMDKQRDKKELWYFAHVIEQVDGTEIGRQVLLNAKRGFTPKSRAQENLDAILKFFK